MRGGTLDRQIIIQRKSSSQSSSGAVTETWNTISTRWSSRPMMTSADERFNAEQLIARAQFTFIVRWSSDVSDLTPLDRIIYPASALSESPLALGNNTYDILAVEEVGRHESLKIFTAVTQDVTL